MTSVSMSREEFADKRKTSDTLIVSDCKVSWRLRSRGDVDPVTDELRRCRGVRL